MSESCCFVRPATVLFLSTITAIPSIATMFSTAPPDFSLSFKFLEASPISQLPLRSDSIPADEPEYSTVTVTPLLASMKVSASASASFCIDVEPASEIVPESFLSASAVFVVSCSVCCVVVEAEPVVEPCVVPVVPFPAELLLQPVTIIIDIAAHANIAAHFLNKFFLISLPLSSRNTAYILFHTFFFSFS